MLVLPTTQLKILRIIYSLLKTQKYSLLNPANFQFLNHVALEFTLIYSISSKKAYNPKGISILLTFSYCLYYFYILF